jgi:NAD-dependent dihydropyrimidine dehydrogenase PreA subunit
MAVRIDHGRCCSCGGCVAVCPRGALELKALYVIVNEKLCNDCALCLRACPLGAILPEAPGIRRNDEIR